MGFATCLFHQQWWLMRAWLQQSQEAGFCLQDRGQQQGSTEHMCISTQEQREHGQMTYNKRHSFSKVAS
jgi:hypothetical protein